MRGKIFLLSVMILVVVASLGFVSAAVNGINFTTPANYTNLSGADIVFNVSFVNGTQITTDNVTDISRLSNFTYNLSATWTLIPFTSFNCSANSCWANVSTTGLTDGLFTMRATIANTTGFNTTLGTYNTQIRIDNTGPAVSSFTTVVPGFNATNLSFLNVNVSVNDSGMGIDSVYFNVTNSSGDQVNWTKAIADTGGYYNVTINMTNLGEGVYNVTVWANDTQLANLNNTEFIKIVVDGTNPAVTLTAANTTESSLTIAVASTDDLSNLAGTCTVDRAGANVYRSGTDTQTLTESSLTCNTAYSYTATCTDESGNSGTSAATSFTTSACPSGGASGGSTGVVTRMTYKPSEEQLTTGYTKEVQANDVVNIKVNGGTHTVRVSNVESSTVTLIVSSDPVTVTLSVGDTRRVDVNGDGTYDVSVMLNSITNGKADVTITKISEVVTDVSEAEQQKQEDQARGTEEVSTTGSSWWVWVLIVVVIVLVAIWFMKRKPSVPVKKK